MYSAALSEFFLQVAKKTGSCHFLKLQLPVKRKHRVYTCRSLYLLTRCFPNEGLPTDKTSTDWLTFSPRKPLGLIGSIVNRFSLFLRNLFLRWPPQSAIANFPLWITASLLLLTLIWITAIVNSGNRFAVIANFELENLIYVIANFDLVCIGNFVGFTFTFETLSLIIANL
jgi:cellulose synthase/poly-beta-1,6-N-acetylglucosamine synthase-like glycosyltransferase